ncbi:hypothetical protein [Ferrimicrobium acidiphilum]|jgi:hypothetical protein|nr:hypothetical protein [Ferrimicrobium acidiphilum]
MGEESIIGAAQDQACEHDPDSQIPVESPTIAIEIIDIDGICGVY